jgi:hypothetical protein
LLVKGGLYWKKSVNEGTPASCIRPELKDEDEDEFEDEDD